MYVEDQVYVLRIQAGNVPFCWLVCFEDRPLQGIPPGEHGPHLLLFSTKERAESFIMGRRRYFGDEPLSVVGVDAPATVKVLVLAPARDARYSTPPCGIAVDFDYSVGKARRILAPAILGSMGIGEISSMVSGMEQREREPAPTRYQAGSGVDRTAKIIVLGLFGIFLVLVAGCLGVWYFINRAQIQAFPFPASQTPTPTSTAIPTSTASPVPPSTKVPFDVNIIDDFSSNANAWPDLFESNTYDCGPENMGIQLGKLTWEFKAVGDCFREQYPDMPWVKDFDVSVDIRRVSSTGKGGFGLVFRNNGKQSYYFEINDADRTFVVYTYKNEWITLVESTSSARIRTGETNTLGISARGTQFTFFINGSEVAEMNDPSVPKGKIGLGAELFDTDASMYLEIDNLELHGKK